MWRWIRQAEAWLALKLEAPCRVLTNVARGGVQVEDDFGDLDDTQVAEWGRKRWNEDHVARDVLTRCVEDAAGRDTAELKAVTSRLLQDAAERDRRQKVVSDSVCNRITNIEQRVQDQWVVFEKVDRK